jgi:hypothetical protein
VVYPQSTNVDYSVVDGKVFGFLPSEILQAGDEIYNDLSYQESMYNIPQHKQLQITPNNNKQQQQQHKILRSERDVYRDATKTGRRVPLRCVAINVAFR